MINEFYLKTEEKFGKEGRDNCPEKRDVIKPAVQQLSKTDHLCSLKFCQLILLRDCIIHTFCWFKSAYGN
jgi:hypothetical protein